MSEIAKKKLVMKNKFIPIYFFKNHPIWVTFFFGGFPIKKLKQNFVEDHPMNIHTKFYFKWASCFREED